MDWKRFDIYVDRAFNVAAALFILAVGLLFIAIAVGMFVFSWKSL